MTKASANLAKSNFSIGTNNNFDGLSQNRNDFQNHGATYDPQAKAKRMELVNALRKSNLPPQHFDIPKSTAQESYNLSGKKDDDATSIK